MSFYRWFLPALAVIGAALALFFLTSLLWSWPAALTLSVPESEPMTWPETVLVTVCMLAFALIFTLPDIIEAWRRPHEAEAPSACPDGDTGVHGGAPGGEAPSCTSTSSPDCRAP